MVSGNDLATFLILEEMWAGERIMDSFRRIFTIGAGLALTPSLINITGFEKI
jgi:hypothetical protein